MDQERVVIAPGYYGLPYSTYRPWLKRELEQQGFEVSIPFVINFLNPHVNSSVELLSKSIGVPDENTYLVVQSLAVAVALNYLSRQDEKVRFGGAVFIAGFTNNLGYRLFDSFFQDKFDYDKINRICPKIEIIHCKDDNWVPVKEAYELRKNLNAKLTITETGNHFCDLDMIKTFPEALKAVTRMSKIKVAAR